MTRTEVAKLMEWLGNAYPNFKGFPDPKAALTTWEGVLGFYDAKVVYMAARLHVEECKFDPSIADLKDRFQKAEIMLRYQAEQNRKKLSPEPPRKQIAKIPDSFCEVCGLCDECNQQECPFGGI